MLRNPIYGGWMPYGDELFPGEHAAIVDEDTYKAVRSIVDSPVRAAASGGRRAPEYILKGLLVCGRCGSAMCPASSNKKGRKYRYYRCVMRDKHGKHACPAKELPAEALEKYVLARLTEATLEKGFAAYVADVIKKRIAKERAALQAVRADLPVRIAQTAAQANKLTEDMQNLSGCAKELVYGKIQAAAERLAVEEKALADTERRLSDLRIAERQSEWAVSALTNIDRVWDAMTHENRGRLLRAVVARVSVDESKDVCAIELVNFASFALTEAA